MTGLNSKLILRSTELNCLDPLIYTDLVRADDVTERAPQLLRLSQENPQKSLEAFSAEYTHFVHVSCVTRILRSHVLADYVILDVAEILWEKPRTFQAILTFVFCRLNRF